MFLTYTKMKSAISLPWDSLKPKDAGVPSSFLVQARERLEF